MVLRVAREELPGRRFRYSRGTYPLRPACLGAPLDRPPSLFKSAEPFVAPLFIYGQKHYHEGESSSPDSETMSR